MDYSANFVFISLWHAVILFKQTFQKKKTQQEQQQQQILSKFDRNEPKRRSMSSRMIQLSSDFSASSKICGNTSTTKLSTCTRKPHNNDYKQSLGRLRILVDHWGEQKRPSNNGVLGREVGRMRPQGQAKRGERGQGRGVVARDCGMREMIWQHISLWYGMCVLLTATVVSFIA